MTDEQAAARVAHRLIGTALDNLEGALAMMMQAGWKATASEIAGCIGPLKSTLHTINSMLER